MMSLQPTFEGFVKDTENALTLIQAVINGILQPVPRRPDEGERDSLIRSGNVFIIDEQASGVQRWTDGVKWSPSRILGNFLLYRQQKDGNSVSAASSSASSASSMNGTVSTLNDLGSQRLGPSSLHNLPLTPSRSPHMFMGCNQNMSSIHNRPHNDESSLLGSLIDPGKYDDDGLMKKTISVPYRGTNYRLISYYRPSDVLNGRLVEPMRQLPNVQISPELEEKKPFRGREIEIPDYSGPLATAMEHSYSNYAPGVANPEYGLYTVARGSYHQESENWGRDRRGSDPVQIPLRQTYPTNIYEDPVANDPLSRNEGRFSRSRHRSLSQLSEARAETNEHLSQHHRDQHDHDHLIADVFKTRHSSPNSPAEQGSAYEYPAHDTSQQIYYAPSTNYGDYPNGAGRFTQTSVSVSQDAVINQEVPPSRSSSGVPWNGY